MNMGSEQGFEREKKRGALIKGEAPIRDYTVFNLLHNDRSLYLALRSAQNLKPLCVSFCVEYFVICEFFYLDFIQLFISFVFLSFTLLIQVYRGKQI